MMHFRFLLLLLWLTIGHAWTPPLSESLGRRAILGRLTAGAVTWFALDDPLRAVAQAPLADLPAQVVDPAAEGMSQTFQDKTIGEIEASGIIFKDILKVDRVGDPKVSGVQLYVSEFRRPITERLLSTGGTDLFSDPALAAVSCLKTGRVTVDPTVDASSQGEEVFSQSRSLMFKSIRVRRLYDKEAGALVYVSYSTRLDKGSDENKSRFKTSICAIKADD
uniref:Uncharacterized protein n=1 Tax=Haptolina ericina TaxID=156174 RepID=A0A7S3ERS3_9EUKA|mmetsp:Transcript_17290/g.38821  ORF Transcript_17290/g.38821 Transcript_17290/m.38821 type:complete len:221 (+) Transcript_17290:3-665(+)